MHSDSAFGDFFRIPHAVNVFAGRNRRNAAVRTRCHKLSYGFCSAIPRCKNLRSGSLAVLARTDKTALIKLHKLRKHTVVRRKPNGYECAADRKLPFLTRFAIFNTIPESLPSPMKRATVLFRTGSMFAQAASPSATCFSARNSLRR